jgi:hypothetical protein
MQPSIRIMDLSAPIVSGAGTWIYILRAVHNNVDFGILNLYIIYTIYPNTGRGGLCFFQY